MRTVTVACLFLFCVAGFAQSDRGTITGTIGDPAGAVVAGAKVEARNVETGTPYEVASTGTGNYTLSQLPAGTYEMSIAVPGFKRYVRQNIVVQVAGARPEGRGPAGRLARRVPAGTPNRPLPPYPNRSAQPSH